MIFDVQLCAIYTGVFLYRPTNWPEKKFCLPTRKNVGRHERAGTENAATVDTNLSANKSVSVNSALLAVNTSGFCRRQIGPTLSPTKIFLDRQINVGDMLGTYRLHVADVNCCRPRVNSLPEKSQQL